MSQSLFQQSCKACNFVKKGTLTHVFSVEFFDIFRNTYSNKLGKILEFQLGEHVTLHQNTLHYLTTCQNFCFGRSMAEETQFCEGTISKVSLKLFTGKINCSIKTKCSVLKELISLGKVKGKRYIKTGTNITE